MDIATLLESHRKYMLAQTATLYEENGEEDAGEALQALSIAHDRATTKTLLDLYRTGQANGQQPVGQAAQLPPATVTTRRVKAGSKKARDRALKAGQTRRRNLAAKAGQQS